MRQLFRFLSLFAAPVLFISGVVGIIGIGNIKAVWQWFLATALPVTVTFLTVENFLLLLLILVSLYAFWRAAKRPRSPIEVLSTSVTITIDEQDHSKCSIYTVQYLRATRPDVSAYYNKFCPSPNGKVFENIQTNIDGYGGFVISQDSDCPLLIGTEESGWDCIQLFRQTLPYPFYAPIIPSFILDKKNPQKMSRFLSRLVVRRTTLINVQDDRNFNPKFHLITAKNYPQRSIKIGLEFPGSIIVDKEKVVARHQRQNGIYRETVEWANEKSCSVYFKRIRRESAGLYWEV